MTIRLLVLSAFAAAGCSMNDVGDRTPADGGDVPGDSSPETDAPPEVPEATDLDAWYASMPRCPDEVVGGFGGGSSLMTHFPMYPMTYVDVVTGADAVHPDEPFVATWTGIRRLDPPITRECLPAFATDPPGIPCQVDAVIELSLTDGTLVEILIGLAFEDLELFADSRTVTVLLQNAAPYSVPDGRDAWSLELREGDAGPLLLAVRNFSSFVLGRPWSLTESAWTWDDLELAYGDITCVTEPDPCRRVFASRPLVATSTGGETALQPGEHATVTSGTLGYRLTHRRAVERLHDVVGGACADDNPTTESVELVRLP